MENRQNGYSFSCLLGLAFIILKLCNVINWSWWWVTSPFWISAIIVILIFNGMIIIYSKRWTILN